MAYCYGLLTLVLWWFCNGSAASRPNIVIILIDDVGFADVRANWNPYHNASDTPFLDGISLAGIRFKDFHSAASVCTPSRAGLLTGRLGKRTGVVKNFTPFSVAGMPTNETTLAETLKAAGYRTGMIGKWHLGTTKDYHPISRGFDFYFGLPYSNDMGCADDTGYNLPPDTPCPKDRFTMKSRQPDASYPAVPLYHNRDIIEQPVNLTNLADRFAKMATKFIKDESNSNPFLLYAAFTPMHVPLSFMANNQSGSDDRGVHLKTLLEMDGTLRAISRAINVTRRENNTIMSTTEPFLLYAAFTHMHVPLSFMAHNQSGSDDRGVYRKTLLEMDSTIRAISQAINETHQENNTIIWVSGDNGPWEEKCGLAGNAGPFIGYWQRMKGGGGSTSKFTVWEGGHRVPGVVFWPGTIPPFPDTGNEELISALDIYPTVATLANVSLPGNRVYDGIDVSDLLLGKPFGTKDRVLFHPNSDGGEGSSGRFDAVRVGDFKAIYQTGGELDCEGNAGKVEHHDPPLIFNLREDPLESRPLDRPSEQYRYVHQKVVKALSEIEHSIQTDNTTVADYTEDPTAEPCCNPDHVRCRCQN